jgi:disulfide oxidoreductase YuzD
MDNKTWIEANLEGKVKARALRACEEQPNSNYDNVESVSDCFSWRDTKEGENYWWAVCVEDTNPDRYLPVDYIDVDQTPIEEAAQQALRKIEQAKKVNHIVEPTEMVEDKFLEWLEIESKDHHEPSERHYTLMEVIEKYNELKK